MRGDPEAQIKKRDSAALYDSLDSLYLSPVDGFDELASTYDQRMAGNPILTVESAEVLGALPSLTGKQVADIGCGTGRYALQMARLGIAASIGIDLSPEMLHVAERKAKRSGDSNGLLTWLQGDLLEGLPLEDRSVDVIVCGLTLSFLPEIHSAFREMERILASGGTLIISDYHPHGLIQLRAEAQARNGNKDKVPYLRFTAADGNDCRIAQFPYRVSDLFAAARSVDLTMDYLAELVPDRDLINTHSRLRSQIGVPIALIARFQKK